MSDKDISMQESVPTNTTLLKILGRLLSALDASISGKDRSILVHDLANFNLDGVSEGERKLASELIRRALQSLDH
ncbi:hypothetical protein ACQKDS_14315 [Serratia sp. NPDC078593]|uniref:hypothetical protein n=1 Tax=unclassified Serratia (in: enterobacteria) TaxID=2647522 RepID=UPI0037D17129